MMNLRRLLCLSIASLGCVSCASLKKGDSAAAAPEAPAASAPEAIPSDHNDAIMVVDVNGSKETVVIHLRPDLAPKHVANFKKLVSQGYYDGLAVHRAIRGYLVQTGDPLTRDDGNKVNWGTGGPDYKIPAEVKGKHVKGSLAAARLSDKLNPDKSSSGSQFYITLRTAKSLDSGYSVFGEVAQGLDVIQQVSAAVVDTNDVPVKRIEIKSIRLADASSVEKVERKKSTRKTVPDSQKGPLTRFIERIW
ncbi:MAG: peptidylprolyl isomerase [Verrucomicrobiales bacterium]|nr:peptidylprolyl isomerase [Verrucomicrobiales bacterium]